MAKETYLDTLKKAIQTSDVSGKARAAGNWFRGIVNRTKGAFSDETPSRILSRQTAFSSNVLGKMYFFSYDPKWKDKLPWYDRFPLIFPIERYNDGFLGINFHYLHPRDRAILMDELKEFLDSVSLTTKAQTEADEAEANSRVLARSPLGIYIG